MASTGYNPYDWGNKYSIPVTVEELEVLLKKRQAQQREAYRALFAEAKMYPFEHPPYGTSSAA